MKIPYSCDNDYIDTNNNNKKSIKFINVISSDSLSYKKNICLLIDSKKVQNDSVQNKTNTLFNTTDDMAQIHQLNEDKINKLFKGVPVTSGNFGSTSNINNTEIPDENSGYGFQYHFYSYFYPCDVDEALAPFLEHIDKDDRSANSHDDDIQQTKGVLTEYGGDRRLKSVENKCRVKIKIGNLGVKLIRGLPRRKVTISAQRAEHIATALSCMEDCIPELFDNALFTMPLECKTQKWPNSKGFLLRRMRKSMHFHKRSLNCPLMSNLWYKSYDPRRVFPFSNINTKRDNLNRSNEFDTMFTTQSEEAIDGSELMTKIISNVNVNELNEQEEKDVLLREIEILKREKEMLEQEREKELNEQENNNKNRNVDQYENSSEKRIFSKYLKFPSSEESDHLFQSNILGEPVNAKFKEYLKLSRCIADNMKCRMDKLGTIYNIVKVRYQDPSQLVKLFLLLNYKIKY